MLLDDNKLGSVFSLEQDLSLFRYLYELFRVIGLAIGIFGLIGLGYFSPENASLFISSVNSIIFIVVAYLLFYGVLYTKISSIRKQFTFPSFFLNVILVILMVISSFCLVFALLVFVIVISDNSFLEEIGRYILFISTWFICLTQSQKQFISTIEKLYI